MLSELAVSSVMVIVTVALHGLGLSGLGRLTDWLLARHGKGPPRIRLVLLVVLGLFVLHGLEIWLYAVTYLSLGAVTDPRASVYVSTLAYSTIGYPERLVASEWHLVAAIEGINGILLLGWTTAFFVTTMEQTKRRR